MPKIYKENLKITTNLSKKRKSSDSNSSFKINKNILQKISTPFTNYREISYRNSILKTPVSSQMSIIGNSVIIPKSPKNPQSTTNIRNFKGRKTVLSYKVGIRNIPLQNPYKKPKLVLNSTICEPKQSSQIQSYRIPSFNNSLKFGSLMINKKKILKRFSEKSHSIIENPRKTSTKLNLSLGIY